MGRGVSGETVFVLSDPLRHGVLRTLGAGDALIGAEATAAVERLMRDGRFADAARIAILGRRHRSASQALRYAAARGTVPFSDLFGRELVAVSYREAKTDPLLAVTVAVSRHSRLIDSAREELLASAATDAGRVGESDEHELVGSFVDAADAERERALWGALIELIALRALGDWRALPLAVRRAVSVVAATPIPLLAGIGPLRSLLISQIELTLALLGEPEYASPDRHRRLSTALCPSDRSRVLGAVALAAAIRGDLPEARDLLRLAGPTTPYDAQADPAPEHHAAVVLVALEARDEAAMGQALGDLLAGPFEPSGLGDLARVAEARFAYLQGRHAHALEGLRTVTRSGAMPWAHAEALAFRIECHLSEGLFAQAQGVVEEVQRTPFSRWHVIRLAIAKSRFAQDQVDGALKIADSIRSSDSATPRHHARALAVASACARRLGDAESADSLLQDMRFYSLRGGLQEPHDDLPADPAAGRRPSLRPALPTPASRIELTKRELAVLRSLTEATSADEIAVHLHVSKNTIKTQLRHIYRKLGVHTREDALRAAIDEGLF